MEMNLDKTNAMPMGGIRKLEVELDGQELEHFVYIDSTVTKRPQNQKGM